jgi:hypothetical protein
MKCTLPVLAVAMLWSLAAAMEPARLNLKMPSGLEAGQLGLDFEHRFQRGIHGASIAAGLRYAVWRGLELSVWGAQYYDSPRDHAQNELSGGLGYTVPLLKVLRVQADAQYFSYSKPGFRQRRQNVFLLLAARSDPILKVFTPYLNAGYDGYQQRIGLGAGLNAGLRVNLGLLRRLGVIGEYSPLFSPGSPGIGTRSAFAAGLFFQTVHHQFQVTVGNTVELGNRRALLGAVEPRLHLGFNIFRVDELGGL